MTAARDALSGGEWAAGALSLEHGARADSTLRLGLLGGFRAERAGTVIPALAWQRRNAKQLTKILATVLNHAMHRDQIFEILWPRATVDSARNSLAKALHAARQALEPERAPRQHSIYLIAHDDMITLDTDRVLIDADDFQRLAQRALRTATVPECESALAHYKGVLLPEDRYEDWAAERRRSLADLNLRLLLRLADLLQLEGDQIGAIDCLNTALQEDGTREDAHRSLMRLYSAIGARDLALRQFALCRAELLRELNRPPHPETAAVYEELLDYRVGQSVSSR